MRSMIVIALLFFLSLPIMASTGDGKLTYDDDTSSVEKTKSNDDDDKSSDDKSSDDKSSSDDDKPSTYDKDTSPVKK